MRRKTVTQLAAGLLGVGALMGGAAFAKKNLVKFFSMTRKPEGKMGELMVRSMNAGHAKVSDWGLSLLTGITPHELLDAGCGGGRNAAKLLERYPEARLTALDYSPVSVEKTREFNRDAVAAGRCAVVEGNVAKLDFADERFDLVTAFETVYFWPGLTDCFAEVCRVLKSGGTFLIVNESDGEDAASRRWEEIIDGMRCYTEQQLMTALKAAGFSAVRAARHTGKPWLSIQATK